MLHRVIHDQRTLTGKNAKLVCDATAGDDIFNLRSTDLKKEVKFKAIEDSDMYRVDLIKEITNLKQNVLCFQPNDDQLTTEELDDILDFVASS